MNCPVSPIEDPEDVVSKDDVMTDEELNEQLEKEAEEDEE